MAKREAVPNRQYTGEFKIEAVRLAESIGSNQAAKRLGIPESSLSNWVRRARAGRLKAGQEAAPTRRSATELEAENARLRRELVSAKLDLEIVKKSGGVFREGVAVKYAWIEKHRDRYSQARRSGRTRARAQQPAASGAAACSRRNAMLRRGG